jgi:transcriptional regulator with GAF, ATPase, and Fis domain
MSAGRRSEARTLLCSVLEQGDELGDRRARAFALANLSTFATDTHDYGEAIDLLERAIDDVRALGDQPRLSRLIANLAELRLRVGMIDEAEQALTFARQACGPTPGGPTAALISYVSAHARLSRGHTLQAAAEIDDAIRAADTSSNGGKLTQCCRLATRIALEDGDVSRARRYLARARAAGPYQESEADIAVLSAMIDQASGQPFASSAEAALDQVQGAGDVELTRQAHVLCHLALRDEDPEASVRSLDAALRLRDHLAAALPERLRAGYLGRRDMALLAKLELQAAAPVSAPATLPPPKMPASAPSLECAMKRLVGEADAMLALRSAIGKVGRSDATVLVNGESGTGKELVADAIHAASDRAHGPLVKINCAALVETLLLSELFGHERGAFTGAHAKRRGRFEQADGGTIFLDEIGDISPKTQVALLRVLQERTFERVGGTAPVHVDVRVICATHRDLAAMVEKGQFREDLYYRLCGVALQTPALRGRLSDLGALSEALLDRIAREQGAPAKRLSPMAIETLVRHRWPGNVRELENALRAAALFADGRVIGADDLTENVGTLEYLEASPPSPVSHARSRGGSPTEAVYAEVAAGMSLPDMKRALERACIERALAETDGNITKAAALLGMKRPRLSQLVNQYGREDAAKSEGVAS